MYEIKVFATQYGIEHKQIALGVCLLGKLDSVEPRRDEACEPGRSRPVEVSILQFQLSNISKH